jgi:hypothetical protein
MFFAAEAAKFEVERFTVGRSAMTRNHVLSAAAVAAALFAACMAEGRRAPAPRESGSLAGALRNYEQSGPAVSCVSTRDLRGNRSAGEGSILFEGQGRMLWVNRPPSGCPELGLGRALKTQIPGTRLCRGDIVTVFDPVSGFEGGSCGLGDFTPYKRNR